MKRKPSGSHLAGRIGRRLRELRRAAGLSLRGLSRRMAPMGRGYQNVLLCLEQGKYASPSITLIADYLRACRAKFADVADVLEEYVAGIPKAETAARELVAEAVAGAPEPLQREVRELDARLVRAEQEPPAPKPGGKPKSRRKPLSPEERVARARRMIARRFRRVRLEEVLYQVISVPEAESLSSEQLSGLCGLGRRRFQILERTRGGRRRRRRQLDEEGRRVDRLGLPEEWVQTIVSAVDRLFEEMERSGALDRLPAAKDFGPGFKELRLKPVPGAEKRLVQERRERLRTQARQRAAAEAMVIAELDAVLHFSRMTGRERHWHLELLRAMFDIAVRHDASPQQRDEAISRLVSSASQPAAAQAVYERFKTVFPKFRRMALSGRRADLT